MSPHSTYLGHGSYGTPNSELLKEICDAGFKPIGITILMCEETFIFKNKFEAVAAAEKFLPEGWWYGIDEWIETRKEYVKDMYHDDEDLAPIVYWLDKNYAPKK
jgi:hypothetical protein